MWHASPVKDYSDQLRNTKRGGITVRLIIRCSITLLLITGLSTCSSGPGQGLDYNGSYAGTLQGVPAGVIELQISGSSVTGTIDAEQTARFRGQGDPPHSTFTGVRDGREVTIEATIVLEIDLGIPPEVNWQNMSTILAFTARFTETGILVGTYYGGNPMAPDNPFSGSWSVQKTTSLNSTVTGPAP
jgi:hypothetical protein